MLPTVKLSSTKKAQITKYASNVGEKYLEHLRKRRDEAEQEFEGFARGLRNPDEDDKRLGATLRRIYKREEDLLNSELKRFNKHPATARINERMRERGSGYITSLRDFKGKEGLHSLDKKYLEEVGALMARPSFTPEQIEAMRLDTGGGLLSHALPNIEVAPGYRGDYNLPYEVAEAMQRSTDYKSLQRKLRNEFSHRLEAPDMANALPIPEIPNPYESMKNLPKVSKTTVGDVLDKVKGKDLSAVEKVLPRVQDKWLWPMVGTAAAVPVLAALYLAIKRRQDDLAESGGRRAR